MSLAEAIKSIPDWQNKTVQELHTVLNEVHTTPDPTPYTFATLGEELTRRGMPGSAIRSQLSYTMMQIEIKEKLLPTEYEKARGDIRAAYIAMSATAEGLSLHLIERQQLVGLLAQVGEWPAGMLEAVLSLGVKQTVIWDATEEQIQEALIEIETQTAAELAQAKRTAQASALRYGISQLESGVTLTNAELINLIQSNLPSE